MSGYLQAFWRGETTGLAEALGWTGLVLLGIALAGVIVVALCALVRFLEGHELADDAEIPPVPMHRSLDELAPLDTTERRRRDRFTSLIAVLGLLAAPVIALTR